MKKIFLASVNHSTFLKCGMIYKIIYISAFH